MLKLKDLILEQPPQPPDKGGEEKSEKPSKLKINIPNSPFEPDLSEVKSELQRILKQWKVKQYMSDEHRWKSYYKDIAKLVKQLEGNDEV